MRRLGLLLACAAICLFGITPGLAASGGSHKDAGEESAELQEAIEWFSDQRMAPGFVNPNAYAAAIAQGVLLPSTPGTWTERTSLPGADGNDFSDPPAYIDPTSNFSNSGAGDRWVSGRMTALAATPGGGTLFAGAADGGVWKSTDGGQHWTPTFDKEATLSIGALLVAGTASSYTVYAGTGEANTSSDSYAGVGVLKSTNGGGTWSEVGGPELNGALVFRIVQNGTTLLAATSHGLYSFNTASSTHWTAALQPAGAVGPGGNFNLAVGNMITDVAIRPGTGGQQVMAVAGWRAGAPTNGL
jgi:hypothetical protein